MTQDNPKAHQQPELSACHKAPVTIGGSGDSDDKDRVVTQYYVCSECHEPCDLYVGGQTETDDPRFKPGHHECSCHNPAVKTIAPCYLCREQISDEQCSLCAKVGTETDEQLQQRLHGMLCRGIHTIGEERLEQVMVEVRRYSHHQTEQVLERLKENRYIDSNSDGSIQTAVIEVADIYAELARLRRQPSRKDVNA